MILASAGGGFVPRIWWYEILNALVMNERRERISPQQLADALAMSLDLGIEVDAYEDHLMALELARRYRLTVYDAAYLEIAQRRKLMLATFDHELAAAAREEGVEVFGEGPIETVHQHTVDRES